MHSLSHNKALYRLSLSAMLIAAMSFASSYILPSTTSALTYSSDTDVSFTFNPTLSISLSNANINIDNLLPGLSSESSPITVHVNSNTPYGYSLFASVGNSTDYNTTSLVHKSNDNNNSSNDNNNSIPSTFTSIATNASLPQLDTDNTWGYSFSNDNGSTWSNYNGLPLYSTVGNNTSTNNPALLIDTKSPADSTKSIDFKIAAKASATQASGTYNNVINFYAVGKPEPPLYMQDTNAIKAKLTNEHDTAVAIDQRDGREYAVARLKDGKIWMTQNLDLAGKTSLYSETSDVPEGYSRLDGSPYYILPPSSTNFLFDNSDYVYNVPYTDDDRSVCADNHPCYSYYSWLAATAGGKDASGTPIYSDNTDAAYSVCPKGWKLPNSRSNIIGASDFYQLAVAYGMNASEVSESGNSFYTQAGPGTIPNFLLTGYYLQRAFYGGNNYGYYRSSTSNSYNPGGSSFSYGLGFSYSSINSVNLSNYHLGGAVRCLVR